LLLLSFESHQFVQVVSGIEGDWPYLWIDATYVKVRQNGRIVSAAAIIAVGVNNDGRTQSPQVPERFERAVQRGALLSRVVSNLRFSSGAWG
jgi:hypothetical protein